jgi:hypothetical protein
MQKNFLNMFDLLTHCGWSRFNYRIFCTKWAEFKAASTGVNVVLVLLTKSWVYVWTITHLSNLCQFSCTMTLPIMVNSCAISCWQPFWRISGFSSLTTIYVYGNLYKWSCLYMTKDIIMEAFNNYAAAFNDTLSVESSWPRSIYRSAMIWSLDYVNS